MRTAPLSSRAAETRAIWRRQGFVYGLTDCLPSVAGHVARATGRDPFGPWRGAYGDEAGAAAILNQWGGMVAFADHAMGLVGLGRGEPCDGAPVIASVRGREVAGIMLGGRIGFVAPRGMVETRAPILAAWDIQCQR